jgi:hypothetical protein
MKSGDRSEGADGEIEVRRLLRELDELHELDDELDEPDEDVSNTSIQDERPESLLPFFFFRFGSQPIQIAKVTARLIGM